jgi:S-formylglutathione hydrolase
MKKNLTHPFPLPGGLKLPGEEDSWDFGTGAGFYVDATQPPYASNYKMYSYITSELPAALYAQFQELDSSRVSIMGHSMGGHGALTLYLKNPGMYKSVSAFAPIANPSKCPWGEKAFGGYLGPDTEAWREWDASELVGRWKGKLDVLIDVVGLVMVVQYWGNADRVCCRARTITFINKSSFCRRILWRLLRRREMRKG